MYTLEQILGMYNKKIEYNLELKREMNEGYINEEEYQNLLIVLENLKDKEVNKAIEQLETLDNFARDVFSDVLMRNNRGVV